MESKLYLVDYCDEDLEEYTFVCRACTSQEAVDRCRSANACLVPSVRFVCEIVSGWH